MEANFFHFFCQEIAQKLQGKRIQKVYVPFQGVCTFQLRAYNNLILSFIPKYEALFLSASKPENPDQPPVMAQWLRKWLKNSKIEDLVADWPRRRLALKLGPDTDNWLVLDLKKGPYLSAELPRDFVDEHFWPSLEKIVCSQNSEIWRSYPQITPPLRRSLNCLSLQKGQELLDSLQSPYSDSFYLYSFSNQKSLLPWKLPKCLQTQSTCQVFNSALQAAEVYGWSRLQAVCSAKNEAAKKQKRLEKKIRRNLNTLDEETKRLQNMVAEKYMAMLLQANLYQVDYNKKVKELTVSDLEGRKRILYLNSELSILENMQKLFRLAAKGQRGLQHVHARKKELANQLAQVRAGKFLDKKIEQVQGADIKHTKSKVFSGVKGLAVNTYRSSDGFMILRGKNKKANHLLLSQAARSQDLWFHAQNCPGAHVVLRLDYENQDVPRQSKIEAAVLAGLASQQAGSDRASIHCACIKHVRKVKGADLGHVVVDQIVESFNVKLDKGMEKRLLIDT